MALPRVFVSSTCYDLKYIRENLKYFVRSLGYEPVMSDEGSVFYDPQLDAADSCLAELPACQMFVLIIGGRFGSQYKDSGHSITNAEYKEAVRSKIPVFALVDQAVFSDLHVYIHNRNSAEVDATKIGYPSVDSTKVFEFVDEVRGSAVNNALVPFSNFDDIQSYLRQQWAGMMHSFLTARNEERRVADTLEAMSEMSARIEMLSKQILESVGTDEAKLEAELYDAMLSARVVSDLTWWKLKPTPTTVLKCEDFLTCARELGLDPNIDEGSDESSVGGDGSISESRFDDDTTGYALLRERLTGILQKHGLTPDVYVARSAGSV